MLRSALAIITFLLISTAAWSADYQVIELHPFWTYESVATDINNQDEVVGWLKSSSSASFQEVFFYSGKKKHHFPGIYSLTTPVLNEKSVIGGTAIIYKWITKNELYPFTWDVAEGEKKVSIPKDWQRNSTYLQDMNDQGEILLTNGARKETSTKVTLLTKKGEHPIPKLTFGKKLNTLAFIAGSIFKQDKSYPASYNRTQEKAYELLPGFEGESIALNDADDVVGVMVHEGQPFGFLHSTMLSDPVPIPHFLPVDINIHMQILGYELDEEGGPYPALWSEGSITRLQLLVDDNIEVVHVNAINDEGVIVGSVRNFKKDKKERAAMLKPKKKG